MNYPSKIQARFEESISVIKDNIKQYLLLNWGLLLIWIWLFAVIFWFLLFFLIFSWLFSFNTNSLYSTNYNHRLIFILIALLIILFLFWVWKATNFIWNFYYTKALDNWKKVKLKNLFLISYKKLWAKALIDLWYFIIFFWLFLSYILLILFFNLLFWKKELIMIGISITLTVLFIYFLIKFFIRYYFASLYCFDTDNFSFKNFNNSAKITKNKKLEIILNILLVWILVYVFSTILWLFIDKILPFPNINSHINNYSVLLSNLVSLKFIIWLVLYFIIRYLIYLLSSVFNFVYMYIYYKYLLNKDKNNN